MRRLILDTDIDTDCDDTGALAVLHRLSQLGEVEILGVVCSIPRRACALCATAINAAYGRPDLPVGLIRVEDWATAPRFAVYQEMLARVRRESKPFYNDQIGQSWTQAHPETEFVDSVRLYRQLLAAAADGTVTVCAVGTLTALHQLLESPADEVSPQTGRELVAARVDRLVTMALGAYPRGCDGFNWRMDAIGAAAVLSGWPTPVTVSELGGQVLVGRRFIDAAPASHPVRRAYEIWLDNWGPADGRPSWDQIAVLRAVRGCGELFTEHGGLDLRFDAVSGEHEWLPQSGSGSGSAERAWIEARLTDAELATVVEDLMIDSLITDSAGRGL